MSTTAGQKLAFDRAEITSEESLTLFDPSFLSFLCENSMLMACDPWIFHDPRTENVELSSGDETTTTTTTDDDEEMDYGKKKLGFGV